MNEEEDDNIVRALELLVSKGYEIRHALSGRTLYPSRYEVGKCFFQEVYGSCSEDASYAEGAVDFARENRLSEEARRSQ